MGPKEKKETNWRLWITGILIALVVVVCLQNAQKVTVEVLFATFDAPLIIMLAVFTLIGVLIGYIGPVWRRHRHEEKRAGQDLEKRD
ncbi:MAG: LapA family protein [Actinobacteria bacterium]|nr:LapA family protein [Actinomycetota bacterium]